MKFINSIKRIKHSSFSIAKMGCFILFLMFAYRAAIGQDSPRFRNSFLSLDERMNALIEELTLQEKISLLDYDSPGVERLDIPKYNWWNEALHGVARAGEATVFPQTIGLAATFNDSLVIAVIGLTPVYEGEDGDAFLAPHGGDKADLNIPAGHLAFMKALRNRHDKPIIAVVTGGSALNIDAIEPYADAIILAWYPGEQGGNRCWFYTFLLLFLAYLAFLLLWQ